MDVNKHIDRAEKEVGRRNFDLAISLYDQILALDPDNGRARSGKRRAELAKFQKSYPSPLVSGLKNLGHRLGIGIGRLLRAHGMVANLAEKALTNDPRNVGLNMALGEALLKAGHANGAEAAYAVVAEFAPDDIEALKTLGRLYYQNKKFDESLECYERVIKIAPRDQEAVKMRKNLAAEGAIKTGGFETAKSARDLAKSKEQVESLEKRQRLVQSAEDVDASIAALREQAAEAPEDPDLQLRLGQLLLQKRDLSRARECFEEALRLRPDDYETATRLGDVRLQELDERVRKARDEARAGEEGAEDMLRRLVKERRSFRVEEFRRRVKSHPTDTALRFKLGQSLFEDDDIDGAIAEFQIVVKDPKRRLVAMTQLGRAFAKKGLWDLAIKQLTQALEATGGVGEKNLDIVYTLATAYEEQGLVEEARETYSRIYEVDISYRDVSKKLEALRGGS